MTESVIVQYIVLCLAALAASGLTLIWWTMR